MKNTGIVRKIDELGRIVLPIELRRVLGIEEGDPLEVFVDDQNEKIQFRKYRGQACYFCPSTEDLNFFRHSFICSNCLNELTRKHIPESETPQAPAKRRRSGDTLKRFVTVTEQNPQASQKELALLVGVSQGRISQLKREVRLHE